MEIINCKRSFLFLLIFVAVIVCSLRAGSPKIPVIKTEQLFVVSKNISAPLRLAVDNCGVVYVTDKHNNICRYDSSGKYLGRIHTNGTPLAIAVSEASLYISERHCTKIKQIDTSGVIIRSFGNLQLPSDMAFDDNHKLYIVDSKLKQVFVFDTKGNLLNSFGKDILTYPTGIAFDKKNRRILVTEHGGIVPPDSSAPIAQIQIFDTQGQWLTGYGRYGSDNGQFIRMQGLAVDQLGRIFVVDSYQGMIDVLDENGGFLGSIGHFGTETGQLRLPMAVLLNAGNHLWITSYNTNDLVVFDITDLPTTVKDASPPEIPLQNKLCQNYPNPFNSGTLIPFTLEKNGQVIIRIYNCMGQKVRTVYLGEQKNGNYLAKGKAYYWDGTNDNGTTVASGFYFYELRLQNYRAVRRMLLVK